MARTNHKHTLREGRPNHKDGARVEDQSKGRLRGRRGGEDQSEFSAVLNRRGDVLNRRGEDQS